MEALSRQDDVVTDNINSEIREQAGLFLHQISDNKLAKLLGRILWRHLVENETSLRDLNLVKSAHAAKGNVNSCRNMEVAPCAVSPDDFFRTLRPEVPGTTEKLPSPTDEDDWRWYPIHDD